MPDTEKRPGPSVLSPRPRKKVGLGDGVCGRGQAEKNDGITTLPLPPSRDHRDEGALTALGLSSLCEVPGV